MKDNQMKQKQSMPGEGLSDQQQAALVQLGQMMGPHLDEFDQRVQQLHDQRHKAEHDATDYEKEFADIPSFRIGREASAKKMESAKTGGAGPGLGPSEAEAALMKQRQALEQQAAMQQQAQAAQSQMAAPIVTPPPAPSGPAGVTRPYSAQKGAVGGPGVQAPPGQEEEEPEEPEPGES